MSVFSWRTRLPGGCALGHRAVEEHLESLRRRWNQHGLEARISACAGGEGEGVVVRYRLGVGSSPDPDGVHTAFRDDLDQALDGLSVPAPDSWDLAQMAQARLAEAVPAARVYQADPGYPWGE